LEKNIVSKKITIEESSHFIQLLDQMLMGYTYLVE
jgi:arginine decarboxylase